MRIEAPGKHNSIYGRMDNGLGQIVFIDPDLCLSFSDRCMGAEQVRICAVGRGGRDLVVGCGNQLSLPQFALTVERSTALLNGGLGLGNLGLR